MRSIAEKSWPLDESKVWCPSETVVLPPAIGFFGQVVQCRETSSLRHQRLLQFMDSLPSQLWSRFNSGNQQCNLMSTVGSVDDLDPSSKTRDSQKIPQRRCFHVAKHGRFSFCKIFPVAWCKESRRNLAPRASLSRASIREILICARISWVDPDKTSWWQPKHMVLPASQTKHLHCLWFQGDPHGNH